MLTTALRGQVLPERVPADCLLMPRAGEPEVSLSRSPTILPERRAVSDR
ncbi:MAG TPA: hypothetical protein PLX43_01095 [Nitrobacter sp.]|nr:hypothetical protein [Nitrobacter sp.]